MIDNEFLQVGLRLAQSFPALGDDPSECFTSFSEDADTEYSNFERDFPAVLEIMPELVRSIKEASCWVDWWIDDDATDIPQIYEHSESGNIRWRLACIGEAELDRQHFGSSKKMRSIKKDTKAIWNNSFAFARLNSIHNANIYDGFLVVDVTKNEELPVYILDSYRNSNCNGFLLSPRLDDFLDHWSRLAFVKLSEKSLAPFTDNFTQRLDADCSFAKEWRKWLSTGNAPTN